MIGRIKAFLAGFLVGVFIAPRSGRASRDLLLERLAEFFEAGGRRLDDLEDQLVARRSDSYEREEDFEPAPGDPPA